MRACRGRRSTAWLVVLLGCALAPARTHAQPVVAADTVFAASEAPARLPSPRGALLRGAVLPGWGQVYNGQLYKLPVVYGALGGLVVLAARYHADYRLYGCAFRWRVYQDEPEHPYPACEDEYAQVRDAQGGDVSAFVLREVRQKKRRGRDLSVIGVGVVYGLTLLDAYVSAHLLDFDVGEDLTLRLAPAPTGFTATLRLGLGR